MNCKPPARNHHQCTRSFQRAQVSSLTPMLLTDVNSSALTRIHIVFMIHRLAHIRIRSSMLILSMYWCGSLYAKPVSHHLQRAQHQSPHRYPKSNTHFSAERVIWDHQSSTLSATGEVQLIQGQLKLTCSEAKIIFAPARSEHTQRSETQGSTHTLAQFNMDHAQLIKVIAVGQVKVKFRDLNLHATQVIYDHQSRSLSAQGPIRGVWGSVKLRGQSLDVSLFKHRASVHKASVSLPLPTFTPTNSSMTSTRWRDR